MKYETPKIEAIPVDDIVEELRVLREHASSARRMADFYRNRYAASCRKTREMQEELDALRAEVAAKHRGEREEIKRLLQDHVDMLYKAWTKR